MVRVNISLSDEDRDRFREQAKREGMSLSAWLHAAAKERLGGNGVGVGPRRGIKRVHTAKDREAFFRKIDALHGPDPKPSPTWEEINRIVDEGMRERHSGA
ncbi:MAG: hypothetical protein OXT51_04420 [Chloroflexota bacterium]|nr:hypothetical protein [Chloroflexota bacterium]